ncbi:MAG: DUF4198 domain-containing protein [Gemmataceae bacterium]|nr:DUF4198 domain-containing protein [Gemmataceae bacterium]
MGRVRLLSSLLVVVAGCVGGSDYAPVSGVVTLNGAPLADAYVTFQPSGGTNNPNPGPGSYAKTDAQGRYTLLVVGLDRKGALIGPHSVSIAAYEKDKRPRTSESADELVNKLAAHYNTETKLTFDVPRSGTDQANFALTEP